MRSYTTRLAILTLTVALAAAACGGGDQEASAYSADGAAADATTSTAAGSTSTESVPDITLPAVPPSDYAGFAAQETACGAETPQPAVEMSFDAPEDQNLDPGEIVRATISTSCGDIVIELDPSIAPETVNSFVFLARSGYFDGSVSHRIVPGFVLQAGDQSATGRGGPGYTIPDELPEAGFLYEAGSLAMANSGPGTTGSQFFITLADAPLPNDYTFFGKVVDGFDTLDAIAQIPLGVNAFGEQSVPLETLYIEQVTIDG
jgi:cyclophilin family peptidyl-prolyl cis-trans isomerase